MTHHSANVTGNRGNLHPRPSKNLERRADSVGMEPITQKDIEDARARVREQCERQGVTVHLDPARLGPIARWLAGEDIEDAA